MEFTDSMQRYQHDITGKFQDISSMVGRLKLIESSQINLLEGFLAVHEVLIRMVETSKKTIENNPQFQTELVIHSDERESENLFILLGLKLGVSLNLNSVTYFYSKLDNHGDHHKNLATILNYLPVNKISGDDLC